MLTNIINIYFMQQEGLLNYYNMRAIFLWESETYSPNPYSNFLVIW